MADHERFSVPPVPVEWLLVQLANVAKTGISSLKLGNPLAETLAATIASLVSENEYLKKILGSRVLVTPDTTQISIAFGPANRYVLQIPTNNDEEKREVASAMAAASAKILHDLANPPSEAKDAAL